MLQVVNDIKLSLNNKTYLSALALALTLPDICSQVENHVSDGNCKIAYFVQYYALEGLVQTTSSTGGF